jgi:hypothetical protein
VTLLTLSKGLDNAENAMDQAFQCRHGGCAPSKRAIMETMRDDGVSLSVWRGRAGPIPTRACAGRALAYVSVCWRAARRAPLDPEVSGVAGICDSIVNHFSLPPIKRPLALIRAVACCRY